MNNVKELRDALIETFIHVKSGEKGINEAKALGNIAGKIMQTAKTQLDYNKYCQSGKEIKFLDSDE